MELPLRGFHERYIKYILLTMREGRTARIMIQEYKYNENLRNALQINYRLLFYTSFRSHYGVSRTRQLFISSSHAYLLLNASKYFFLLLRMDHY